MLFVDTEQSCNCGGRFDAHPSCMVITGSLARTPGLNIALGDPWSVEENDDLMVLHAWGFVRLLRTAQGSLGENDLLKHQQMRQSWCRFIVQVNLERRWQICFPGKEIFGHLETLPLEVMPRDVGASISVMFMRHTLPERIQAHSQNVTHGGYHVPQDNELPEDEFCRVLQSTLEYFRGHWKAVWTPCPFFIGPKR